MPRLPDELRHPAAANESVDVSKEQEELEELEADWYSLDDLDREFLGYYKMYGTIDKATDAMDKSRGWYYERRKTQPLIAKLAGNPILKGKLLTRLLVDSLMPSVVGVLKKALANKSEPQQQLQAVRYLLDLEKRGHVSLKGVVGGAGGKVDERPIPPYDDHTPLADVPPLAEENANE